MTSKESAKFVETVALKPYAIASQSQVGNSVEPITITDLLCDIRHWCTQNKVSWTECLDNATNHYRNEMIAEREREVRT